MSRRSLGNKRHRQYVQNLRVAATLLDGPRALEEIVHRSYSYLIPVGLFKTTERQAREQMASVRKMLEALRERGWIVCEDGRYALTPLGREEVECRLDTSGRLVPLQLASPGFLRATIPKQIACQCGFESFREETHH